MDGQAVRVVGAALEALPLGTGHALCDSRTRSHSLRGKVDDVRERQRGLGGGRDPAGP